MKSRIEDFDSHAPFHQSLTETEHLHPSPSHASGPFKFFNPTSAHFTQKSRPDSIDVVGAHHFGFSWSSRDNRKGRHPLTLSQTADESPDIVTPKASSNSRVIMRGILSMFIHYPIWDISWIVAYIFTWGSVVWVINAMFVYLPLLRPNSEFGTEILYGGGISAFIGATIFEVGSVFLILEALNEERTGCFGWVVERAWKDHQQGHITVHADVGACKHSHPYKHSLFYGKHGGNTRAPTDEEQEQSKTSLPSTASASPTGKGWVWFPTWHELRTHYLREIGFLACLSQLIGASIFWIAGLTALPGINNIMSQKLLDGIYWSPQVIGGCGFIISGTLFMLETQTHWWKPNFKAIGWHIGAWNLLGGIGFTLSGAFGYKPTSWALYQSACSTFWGSFAFLIGSVLQWYESLEKYPVTVE